MLIKLSDALWVESHFIRRLFLQQFNDRTDTVFKIAADLGDKTVYGVSYKNYHEATKVLDWLVHAISEATLNEKKT